MRPAADTASRSEGRGSGSTHMRALVLDGPASGAVRLDQRRPRPQPQPEEALIRPRRCGVGTIDLAVAQGWMAFSGVLGHEFVGMVESVNGKDGAHLPGKRVVGSINALCGKCDMCLAGLRNHCRNRTVLGMSGRDGCLADFFTLPAANLVLVSDSVDDDHAVFAEPLASAIQVARQLHIEGKPYVTILGDGTMGLLAAQVLSRLNASVRVIGRHADNLALCEKWGVKHRHIDEVGRHADQDIVVDCTGSRAGLALAAQLVRPRGKIVLKSITAPQPASEPAVDLTPIVINELEVIGSRCGPIAEAVSMLARREIDVVSLLSKRMSLSDGPAILKAAAKPGVIKVVVDV